MHRLTQNALEGKTGNRNGKMTAFWFSKYHLLNSNYALPPTMVSAMKTNE